MRKLTFKDVKEYIETNSECKVIDNCYVNSNTPIKLLCCCGNEFSVRIGNFRHGSRQCKNCGHKNGAVKQSKTHEQFVKEVYDLVRDEFTVLEYYKTQGTKILFRHNICGNEIKMTPNKFLVGQRCKKCLRNIKTHEEFEQEFKEIVGDEFELISEFKYSGTQVEVKHIKCNSIFKFYPKILRQNQALKCPQCDISLGEKAIKNWLEENNLQYVSQYTILKRLRFDFFIIYKNTQIAIEYQGQQHYYPVDFAGKGKEWARNEFNKGEKRDNIKRKYCANNNIKLIEIPYWNFDNIKNILDNEIFN